MKNLTDLDSDIENINIGDMKFERKVKILNLKVLILIASQLDDINRSLDMMGPLLFDNEC